MSFEDQHFQERELVNHGRTNQDLEHYAEVWILTNNFHIELYDLAIRLNGSSISTLTTAGDDLINALAKLELLKQSL